MNNFSEISDTSVKKGQGDVNEQGNPDLEAQKLVLRDSSAIQEAYDSQGKLKSFAQTSSQPNTQEEQKILEV